MKLHVITYSSLMVEDMKLRFLCEPYGLSAKMQGFATNKESELRRGILVPQRIVGKSKSPR